MFTVRDCHANVSLNLLSGETAQLVLTNLTDERTWPMTAPRRRLGFLCPLGPATSRPEEDVGPSTQGQGSQAGELGGFRSEMALAF